MKSQTRILMATALVMLSVGFMMYRYSNRLGSIQQTVEVQPGNSDSQALMANIVGKIRPDFSLPDLNGQHRSISEWDGKVIAINFWASWCLPCLDEIPELVSLQSLYRDLGFQVIGIALEKPDGLDEFIKQHNMNYPVLAGEEAVIVIAENYGNLVGALPYTAIVDRVGKIVYTKAGPVNQAEVEAIIKGLL